MVNMVVVARISVTNSSRPTPTLPKSALKALAVRLIPDRLSGSCQVPASRMARAVQVQTTRVSATGPIIATRPSRIGSLVRAAPWAITSVPTPASLENAPRLMPTRTTPSKPPPTAWGLKASRKIEANSPGTWSMCSRSSSRVMDR